MNNNILIGAEGLDGANFLCSCLTMSDKIYFNNYTLDEKIKFFFECMCNIQRKNGLPIWNDCSMLFSSCARAKEKLSFSIYQSKSLYESLKLSFNKGVISKIRLPIFWPLTTMMSKTPENPIIKLFESKYFIGLVNPDLFISLRTVLFDSNNPFVNLDLFTVKEFNSLSIEIKEIIKLYYKSEHERLFKCEMPNSLKWHMSNMECNIDFMNIIEKESQNIHLYIESNEFLKNKITHTWDCNWFLTEDDTVNNIQILYSELGLEHFDEALIRKMYKIWINRIDYVKKSYITAFNLTSINNFGFIT